MSAFVILRHGPTDWTRQRRIQGRADRPLSEEGRAMVGRWRVPDLLQGFDWLASPLRRAVETARLMGVEPETDARLLELDWGAWEGESLTALRTRDPAAMAANEARGLDFRPPGGESYRELQDRLGVLLADRAKAGRPTVAVAHNGVILCLLALAAGWDLTGRRPAKVRDACVHRFRLDERGHPEIVELNLPIRCASDPP